MAKRKSKKRGLRGTDESSFALEHPYVTWFLGGCTITLASYIVQKVILKARGLEGVSVRGLGGLSGVKEPEGFKEILKNAKMVAKRDGYDQVVLLEPDGGYGFIRNYEQYDLDEYNKFNERVVAVVRADYIGRGVVDVKVRKSKRLA